MRLLGCCLFVLSLALPLLAAEPRAVVWCANESTKVKPGDPVQAKNTVWNAEKRLVTIGSARNEYVAFQIITRAMQDDVQGVIVEPSELKSAKGDVIPVRNIDLFRQHYLNVTVTSRGSLTELLPYVSAGEHPTQMIPFHAKRLGAPFEVLPERNQPVWVDIYVPDDQAPGTYKGTFRVRSGNTVLSDVDVELTVWNFTLPHETHFRSFLYTGPENLRWGHRLGDDWYDSPRFMKLEDAYFQMAHQHRLNFNPSAGDIVKEVTQRYKKYYTGEAFNERVGRGVGQNTLNMPPEGKNEAEFKKSTQNIVNAYEQNNFQALLFGYIWDEPSSPEDFAESKKRCKWVQEVIGNKLRCFVATPHWQKYDPTDVDIYSEIKLNEIPQVLARGDAIWAVNAGYAAGPFVDSPGFGGRSIVWMNWKMNLGGWQFWDVAYWVDRQNLRHKEGGKWVRSVTFKQINENPEDYLTDLYRDPLSFDETRKKGYPERDAIRINGDGVLFYPGYDVGINGPIASFAMKSLRRGAQDYEYMWLLKQDGREAELKPILDSVIPAPGKWNDDPEAWERARLKLAELLNSRPPKGTATAD